MKLIIYLATCNKTSYILPATIFLYKKFIPNCPLIRVLGFEKPDLPDWENVEFISLAPVQKNINLWSKYLHDYFLKIDDELLYFALDDFFPIDYLNQKSYDFIIDYMQKNKIGNCVVSQEPSSCPKRNEVEAIIKEDEDIFVYKRKKGVCYQIVLQPCIWNRNYLLKIFKQENTPWDLEIKVSSIANKDTEYYNISSSQFPKEPSKCIIPFSTQSSLSSKWGDKISVIGLKSEIVKELIDKKLLDKNKLIIGAWDTYVNWKEDFTKKELKKLIESGPENLNWWLPAYSKYY